MGQQLIKVLNGFGDDVVRKLPAAAVDAFAKADSIINNPAYERISVSISGGGDSDIMLDLLWRIDKDKKCRYVFFNTGIEYRATLEHLDDLEKKYEVEIERIPAKMTIPMSCKKFGQPFLSKVVSDSMHRLQINGFQWEDEPFEVLSKKYPNCQSALRWWTGEKPFPNGKKSSLYTINQNRWLKEFIMQNPPKFMISDHCCDGAKKIPAHDYAKENNIDVMCVGVRKAEGGARAMAYNNCFSHAKTLGLWQYRPLFWFNNTDCTEYRNALGIERSRCYTQYGFKRTGCSGCPFNRWLFQEMESTMMFEPEMNKLANIVFKESYEYTWKYREFQQKMGYYKRKK